MLRCNTPSTPMSPSSAVASTGPRSPWRPLRPAGAWRYRRQRRRVLVRRGVMAGWWCRACRRRPGRRAARDRAEPFIRLVLGAPGEVFALIRRFDIDCGARHSGWLNPAHAPAHRLGGVPWRHRGADGRASPSARRYPRPRPCRRKDGRPDPRTNRGSPHRAPWRALAAGHADGGVTAARVLQATNAQPPGRSVDTGASGTVPSWSMSSRHRS